MCVGLLCLVNFVWVVISLARGSGLTHESGVQCGLAMDAASGTFYPPLLGPGGYGGTRYGPVLILLQAGLIRVGLNPTLGGHLLSLLAAAALGSAMYRLLRQQGLVTASAAGFPFLLLLSGATAYALVEIRPDLLPGALNLWGLVCIGVLLRTRDSGRSIGLTMWAATFFALAILSKMSAGFGVVSAGVVLLLNRRTRPAISVGVATAVLALLGLYILNAASGGRMWENFRGCADPAGRPRVHLHDYLTVLREVFITDDWTGTLLLFIAVCAWLISPTALKRSLPGIYLVVTLPITVMMFWTPGLSVNHLIDLHAATVLYLAVFLTQASISLPHARPLANLGLTAVALCAIAGAARPRMLGKARYARTAAFRHAVAVATNRSDATVNGCGPIFSDNAMIPISVGQKPYLLDDFMFRAVRHFRPAAEGDLYRRLDDRFFDGVVLRYDPATQPRQWALGYQFPVKLAANYDLVGRTSQWDHLWIYRRKP